MQKRYGAYCFLQHLLKLNVVYGIQVQKIHHVTLLYAIKFHNVQRNVSNVNTFDEHYRNES